jgi:2',3'-cyclic-nucleotide 2'-phosphodiesterase (5'-nucleotidase family)
MKGLCRLLLLAALAALSSCNGSEPAKPEVSAPAEAKPEARAEPLEVRATLTAPAREASLGKNGDVYPATVGQAVDSAIYEGIYKGLNGLQRKLNVKKAGADSPMAQAQRPKGKLVTFWFTGNVHGEREDCGCKKHPRGGLTRKATMIRQTNKGGRDLDRPDVQIIADAGDLLFRTPMMHNSQGVQRDISLVEAEAIVASFNEIGCDAFAVGEYDLTFGVEPLLKLKKKAKFPWVSANLRRRGSEDLLFPPFVVRQVDGLKVLFLGMTTDKPTQADFYKNVDVDIEPPAKALAAQADAIKAQAPDVVVLLSNLGMDGTAQLVQGSPVPIHTALVSGSSRSTYEPVWAGGVPILEPGSRGKFMGRLDMHIVNGEVAFAPEDAGSLSLVRDYMNGYRSLHNARRALHNSNRLLKKKGKLSRSEQQRQERMERNLDLAAQRLARVERDLPNELDQGSDEPAPQSWLHNQVVPVELAIHQAPDIRRILDRYVRQADKLRGPNKR